MRGSAVLWESRQSYVTRCVARNRACGCGTISVGFHESPGRSPKDGCVAVENTTVHPY